MDKLKIRSDCPVSTSLDIFGDKWSLLISRDLMYGGACTYSDFFKSPEKIATNILAARLKTLEENQIIERSVQPDGKGKCQYRLTRIGIDLLPVLIEMSLWAEKYFTISAERKDMPGRVKADKAAVLEAMMNKLASRNQGYR